MPLSTPLPLRPLRSLWLLLLALALPLGLTAQTTFTAELSGANEVLPNLSSAEGTLTGTLTGTSLEVTGSFSGLAGDYSASHLHLGFAGQNGGVAFTLNPTVDGDNRGGTYEAANNTFTLTQGQIDTLNARQVYVNIHSAAWPGGELRGQMVPGTPTVMRATLVGSNEVPPNMSQAFGQAIGDLDGTTLVVTGAFAGLEGDYSAAHLHLGYAGENGSVEVTLDATVDGDSRGGVFEPANNTFTLTQDQADALAGREIYLNLHSSKWPGGELRGQMVSSTATTFRATLSGGNEVPANLSNGGGALLGELDGTELIVTGSFNHLRGTYSASHLHLGFAGQNGSVAITLNESLDAGDQSGWYSVSNNTYTVDAAAITALKDRMIYANLHSSGWPAGELRGQMLPEASVELKTFLSGNNEVPQVVTPAYGGVVADLVGSTLTITGAFSGLEDTYAASHLHAGMFGQNGPVEVTLNATVADDTSGTYLASDNTFEVTDLQVMAMKDRNIYVNVHSSAYPGGELRGQMMSTASAAFSALLDGQNEVPPNLSMGHGGLLGELIGNKLLVSGWFGGLMSDFNADIAGGAHLHAAPAGSNGGVAFALTTALNDDDRSGSFHVMDNMFDLTEEEAADLENRYIYANIHSVMLPGGELRGQMGNAGALHMRANFTGLAEVPPVDTDAQGAALLELQGDQLWVSGSFEGLGSAYTASHLHNGLAGENGDVEQALMVDVDDDDFGGVYWPHSNTYVLDEAQIEALVDGEIYVNIHSMDVGSGELRGQVTPAYVKVLEAYLAGENEVPPAETDGWGGAMFFLDMSDGDTLLFIAGSFDDLGSAYSASHIHLAPAGMNGGVEFALDVTADDDDLGGTFVLEDNAYEIDTDQAMALLGGDFYVNVHTADIASGELRGQALASFNVAPGEALLTEPDDDADITITGDPSTSFTVTWDMADDANGNKVAYIWQLATDDTFDDVIVEAGTEGEAMFQTDFRTVADILDDEGVMLNGSAMLYHRVISSDGSEWTAGPSRSVNLTRGTLTSTDATPGLPETFALHGNYPNPFNPTTTLRFDLPQQADVRVEVYNLLGQRVLTVAPGALAAGHNRTVQINAGALASGLYLYRLTAEMGETQHIETGRMILLK